MDETTALKRSALRQKHRLEHYFTIYAAFQDYVKLLTQQKTDNLTKSETVVAFERFRLQFNEHESAFYEDLNGDTSVNRGISKFLLDPQPLLRNPHAFRLALAEATTKFEIMTKLQARDLKEIHEHIAVVEGQENAEQVTGVPQSALKKFTDLDTALEIGHKWLGRAVQFEPWVREILKKLI